MTASPGIQGHPEAPRLVPTRDDLRRLLNLAVPVVVVQLGMMLMGVVTTVMVGHVSAADLAAAALGNLYFVALVLLGWGTLMALDPVVAQAVGAGDRLAVALGIQRGMILAVAFSVLTALCFLPARTVLEFLGQPADVVPLAARYVAVSIPGILPFLVFIVLRQSLQAMGRMRPIVLTILGANLVNAALGWVLIFGHLGCPRLGAVGAGLAATVARWGMALGLLALAWRTLRPIVLPLRRESFDRGALGRMLWLGLPIGIQQQLEYGVFAVVGLLMGRIGTVPMAAHAVALTVASVTFMVPQGIGAVATVLVGQAVGEGAGGRARRAAAGALGSGAAFMLLSGLALILLPGPLARLFSAEAPVIRLAMLLLPIAGVFQVFDGIQVVSLGVLRGVADTHTPVAVNLLGFWVIGLPLSGWLGFGLGAGPAGLWWGLVVGLGVVAVVLLARVRVKLGRPLARFSLDEAKAATGA